MTAILGIAAYGLLCLSVGWGARVALENRRREDYAPEEEFWDDEEGVTILSVRDDAEYQAAMAGVHEDDTAVMHLTRLDDGHISDTVRACEVMDDEVAAFLASQTAQFEAIRASFMAGAR